MAKGKKPIPKTQREISENLHTPYEVSGMQGGVLQNPNDSDYDGDKRGNHVSFKGDKVKPFSISVTDIDEAVVYYIENIIKPTVYQNNKKIMVPVLYGSSERWKQVQKDGYLRDGRNQIMLPLIMFQRTSLEPNRALTNKLDANSPNNYNVTQKSYSSKNAYSNFNVLTNRKQEKEYHTIVVPDYVTVNYDFIVSTHYVEQMNSIIEAINYAADSYWGNPERFKFKAEIDSFVNKIELPADGQRVVKTTFSLKLYGYIIPETIQKDLNSIKKISNKTQLIFGLETTQPYESLSSVSASSLSTGNVVFPGNNSCPSVLIYRNGVLYQTIAAGGEFSYNTGSGGDPIDVQINSSSFLTGVDTNQNIGVYSTQLTPLGAKSGSIYVIQNTYISNSNGTYTQSIESGVSSSIPNAHVTIYNWSGSLITSSNVVSCITSSVILSQSIGYIRPQYGMMTASYLDGDEYYNYLNYPDPTTYNINSTPALLDPTNPHKLMYPNAFGSYWRRTGISGGYYDIDTEEYKLADNTVSDVATTFGAGGDGYFIDHHTGLGWKYTNNATTNFSASVAFINDITCSGFTDFFMANQDQFLGLWIKRVNNFLFADTFYLPLSLNLTMRSSSPVPSLAVSSLSHRGYFSGNTQNAATGSNLGCLAVRYHY